MLTQRLRESCEFAQILSAWSNNNKNQMCKTKLTCRKKFGKKEKKASSEPDNIYKYNN